MIFLV